MALRAEAVADLRRWAISAALVVLAHGGIAAAMVTWREAVDATEPTAAMVVHLAPVPVAPAVQHSELPPGPEQTMTDASTAKRGEVVEDKAEEKVEHKIEAKVERRVEEKVESRAPDEPPPEVPPAANPEVAVAPLPPPEARQETPQPQQPSAPVPVTTAPEALPVEAAPVAAAPEQGKFDPNSSRAAQEWNKRIVALIERHKRYPPAAQPRRERGVAHVFFAIDRQGRVIDSRIVRSSGSATLDEAALENIRRAQPFLAPPPELPGTQIERIIPIRFDVK